METALNNPTLSDAEKRNVQQQAQSKGIAAALGALAALLSLPKPPPKAAPQSALDPATADLTEEECLARLKQSGQYQAYQERMQAWRQQQQRQQAVAAYQAYRQGERCIPLQNRQARLAALDNLPRSD